MMFPKEQRVVDKAYRASAAGKPCENCGAEGSTVGAHPRAGLMGGTGAKPSDDLLLWLCNVRCHPEQETGGFMWLARFLFAKVLKLPVPDMAPAEAMFVVLTILYPMLRRRYAKWKAAQ